MADKEKILEALKEVYDPEIPVLNIVEMGIVRDISFEGKKLVVKITPTYSGCPAMKTIEEEILNILRDDEFDEVTVEKIYAPPWTTDWLTGEAKHKLKLHGIAPPEKNSGIDSSRDYAVKPVLCPFCSSRNTSITSYFGSTACKSLHYCFDCTQPFEHFKCI